MVAPAAKVTVAVERRVKVQDWVAKVAEMNVLGPGVKVTPGDDGVRPVVIAVPPMEVVI